MKRVILGLTIGLLSLNLYSSELKCLDSYDILRGIYSSAVDVRRNGNLEQIKEHNDRFDYPALFNKNHPDQYYLDGWKDEHEYDGILDFIQYRIKSGESKGHKITLNKPKANFISSVGEVCVIPMYYDVTIKGKQSRSLSDEIFVRNIESNEWRVFSYSGDEPEEAFNEFFPNFPKEIKRKLSKVKFYE